MDTGAMGATATGSAKMAGQEQVKKVNQKQFQPEETSSSTTDSQLSQSATSSSQQNSTILNNQDQFPTDKVIMADRTSSKIMMIFIVAMIPAIIGALIWMGFTLKHFGGLALLIAWVLNMRILYLARGFRLPVGLDRLTRAKSDPLLDSVPAAYFCVVLGSGGHTTEMFEFLRKTILPRRNMHRRYIFTTGDRNSFAAIHRYESLVLQKFGDHGGSWDAYQVKRARNVHQSLITAPFSALLSLASIYEALTTVPKDRDRPGEREFFKFPHVITTNGPGNGVMVAIVARMLKLFFVAPSNCMRVVFVETWAHVRTFSLTGKIFHWAQFVGGLADVIRVQHHALAEKYGYVQVRYMHPEDRY